VRRGGASLLGRALPQLSAQVSTTVITASSAEVAPAAEAREPVYRDFQVYRWNPDNGGKPRYDTYKLDITG
jgi:succinate dehydrogenase (ubiquinone) iron-sulfur subunit